MAKFVNIVVALVIGATVCLSAEAEVTGTASRRLLRHCGGVGCRLFGNQGVHALGRPNFGFGGAGVGGAFRPHGLPHVRPHGLPHVRPQVFPHGGNQFFPRGGNFLPHGRPQVLPHLLPRGGLPLVQRPIFGGRTTANADAVAHGPNANTRTRTSSNSGPFGGSSSSSSSSSSGGGFFHGL